MPPLPGQKTALVTGCSPGSIGHHLAIELQAQGIHVIVTARSLAPLQPLLDSGMDALVLDVTSDESIHACRASVGQLCSGRLDILINNAGRAHNAPCTDLTRSCLSTTLSTNLIGPMLLTQALVPLLAPTGLVVNMSSLASVTPFVFGSAYAASKAGLSAYSRVARAELRALGIRVMVVLASTVRSNIDNGPAARQDLPAGSIWWPVRDIYRWRSRVSDGGMDTRLFARGVVREIMRGDGWNGGTGALGWLGWVLRVGRGTPDWYTDGAMSGAIRMLGWFGEKVRDVVVGRTLRGPEMVKRMADVKLKRA